MGAWTTGRIAIFLTKFFSVMKHISHSVDMLINKIIVFRGSENPYIIDKRPLYPEKITV